MNNFSHVPPGFRFHPTDEELVDYYLRKKVSSKRIDVDVIKDIDLYNIEPWDLQEKCRIGVEKQNEWYFFSHKGKKYPTGTRTNRATTAGFWKATGRDKPIYSKHNLVGMRKTLVFYKGRAPNGQKLDWIMHEYRLETNENGHPQEEGWVVCRVFRKRETTNQRASINGSPCWYDEQVSIMPELDMEVHHNTYSCKKEMELHYHLPHDQFLQLPQLESPTLPDYNYPGSTLKSSALVPELQPHHSIVHRHPTTSVCNADQAIDQVMDWRVLDKFVASQLSHEGVSKGNNYPNIDASADKEETIAEYAASTSTSSCQVDLWK